MNKKILLDILVNVLKSQGYGVYPQTGYQEADLVVEKDGQRTYIQYGITEEDMRHFAKMSQVAQGSDCALFVSDRITEWMTFFAEQYNIKTWDRAELESVIGKSILAEAEGVRYELLGSLGEAEAGTGTGAPDMPVAPVVSMDPDLPASYIREIAADFGDEGGNRGSDRDSHEIIALRSAPLRVDEKQAMATAKGLISGITEIAIEFVPFWNYRYRIDGNCQCKTKMVRISAEDSGAINALNKTEHDHIRDVRDQLSVPCPNYEIRRAILTKNEAEERILGGAIASNRKIMAFSSTSGDAIITENVAVEPRLEDIDLDIELTHLPVWAITGARHSVMIDAYDGTVMTVPIDDDVEFL
ncbi:MAG: hypothetical protein ACXQTY_03385 [Candidatus Methanogasteraceae archaeon]